MADTEEQIDIELIKKKAVTGIVTLTLRTVFIQIFTFFATFILTILIEPSIYGIFFLVSAILNLFVYFSDIGLAAALIQKKETPSEDDFKTTFTIQQGLVLTLVTLGLLFSFEIAKFYKLDPQGLLLLRVLLVSLILSSLKTIPSIILERNLNFTKLVIPQIAEHLVFYSVAVTLAFFGNGITSFTYAVLARGVIGLVLIYILSPWIPKIGIYKESAKKLINFGIPYQTNSILALLKDDLLTVFIGKILPAAQVGYIGWAQKFAFTPLRFFMDNVIKVTFPAYSRLQDKPKELAKMVEKSVFFVTFFVYPSLFGLLALAPVLIHIIPNYTKWEPALPVLTFFVINALFAAVNTTLTNTLFAIGKPKIVLNLMVLWTILTWILTIFLVTKFSYVGVSIASAIVAASTSVVIYYVKRHIPLSLFSNVLPPLTISMVMFLIIKLVAFGLGNNVLTLIIQVSLGVFVYFAISTMIYGKTLLLQARSIILSLIPRGSSN